jgi:hypothetical protein
MGGEQSSYSDSGGGGRSVGRITEVANFDFRDFNKPKDDGSGNIGDVANVNGSEVVLKCDGMEMDCLQMEKREKREKGGQEKVDHKRVYCFDTFNNITKVMYWRL